MIRLNILGILYIDLMLDIIFIFCYFRIGCRKVVIVLFLVFIVGIIGVFFLLDKVENDKGNEFL